MFSRKNDAELDAAGIAISQGSKTEAPGKQYNLLLNIIYWVANYRGVTLEFPRPQWSLATMGKGMLNLLGPPGLDPAGLRSGDNFSRCSLSSVSSRR